jgi:hypothetical protein
MRLMNEFEDAVHALKQRSTPPSAGLDAAATPPAA